MNLSIRKSGHCSQGRTNIHKGKGNNGCLPKGPELLVPNDSFKDTNNYFVTASLKAAAAKVKNFLGF